MDKSYQIKPRVVREGGCRMSRTNDGGVLFVCVEPLYEFPRRRRKKKEAADE